MVIRPYNVRFLGYHMLRRVFMEVSFCSKFFDEKLHHCTKNKFYSVQTCSEGHVMSKCFDFLSRLAPNHIPSVLLLFISRPQDLWNSSNSLNRFTADSRSATKAVVSSAYCETLNSLSNIFIPLTVLSCLIAFPNIYAHSTKRAPDSGHPCRTPL